MRQTILLSSFCLFFSLASFAQAEPVKQTMTDAEVKSLMSQLNLDSSYILRTSAKAACNCIDSVRGEKRNKQKEMEGIVGCIDQETVAYQSTLKLFTSMKSATQTKKIDIVVDKNSPEYKDYYYRLERWLKDSCDVMNKAILSNDDASETSYSSNAEARKAYSAGIVLFGKEDYESAIPLFEKAVKIDPVFAFAWDNLGICYRKTGKFEKAEAAYKASLKVDPKGHTALQNLPVVYIYQKKFEEAIAAYENILKFYPGDPEVYYGIGNIYTVQLKDYEKGLSNLCKAYNIYTEQKSPFRADAEKLINLIYAQMKKDNKEETFFKILKENNINPK